MIARFRSFALALAVSVAMPALAQEEKKDGEPPVKPEPGKEEPARPPVAGPADLFAKMAELYPKVLKRPTIADVDPKADPPVPLANLETAWDKAVADLVTAGDNYVNALDSVAPDARALFYRGVGHAIRATRDPAGTRRHYQIAADSMQQYLDAAGEKGEFRADAERWLGDSLLRLKRMDEAIPHLGKAVELLQGKGRHDDAGEAAWLALASLQDALRNAEMRAFAESIDASKADFGGSTQSIRKFANAAKLAVGSPLPALGSVKDADGKDVSWKPGRPLLIHFFHAGYLGGLPSTTREIELEIRPLWDAYREKGLSIVGVSMDYAVPASQAEQARKNWVEWGRKEKYSDGSLETVRDYAATHGVQWPWIWDGKATNNPVAVALGGVAASSPYAILVDKDGIVRWTGGAPFKGLPEAVAKLLP